VLSWCTAGLGRYERAGQLLGAATTAWRLSGGREDEAPTYHAIDDVVAGQARAAIGDEAFAAARERGRAMSVEDVIAFALEEKADRPPAGVSRDPSDSGLTSRERQVAELVAEGLTNRQIANRLTISQRTAEGHVEKVLTKLGFNSRAQIAAWVVERRAGGDVTEPT
jgi:DNA-binding NarL/FixJ family response regulator